MTADPLCTCGHREQDHYMRSTQGCAWRDCSCQQYAPNPEYERHVSHRCTRMAQHYPHTNSIVPLPIPCPDCYSIESIWRRIPYEPDSRTPAQADGSERAS